MKKIIKEIRNKKIIIVIPTYKRIDFVNKIIIDICKFSSENLSNLHIFVIDDDPDNLKSKEKIINKDTFDFAALNGVIAKEYKNTGKHGITGARKFAIKKAMRYKPDHVIYSDDDAFPKRNCIERMVALQHQDNRIAISATVGNYMRFWRDFKKDDVRFYHSLGIIYSISPEFISKCGLPNVDIVIRSDHEYLIRAWKNGYFTAAVYAPVKHKRFSDRDDGSKLFDNKSKQWYSDAKKIEKLYPDMVKVTKDAKIRIKFKYPDIKYKMGDDLILRKARK
jgi:hypothetical protein